MNDQLHELGLSSWTLERPFRFESSGTLQEVVHALAALEEQGGFFSSSRNEMSILPLNDGYTFRYRIRRRTKNRRSQTSAYGEGQIWENPDGSVTVEGVSQIEPWSLYGSVGMLIVISVIFGVAWRGFGGLMPLLFIGLGAFTVYSSYQDRNRVIDNIAEAVGGTISMSDQFRRAKDKREPTSEKVKNTRLSVDEVARPDSVWSEAISEYEDDEQERDRR